MMPWLRYIGLVAVGTVLFYLRFWSAESARGGSWRAGHERLWKKPKPWQVITFCVLWGFIVVSVALLFVFGYARIN